jgi:hypothetical protein
LSDLSTVSKRGILIFPVIPPPSPILAVDDHTGLDTWLMLPTLHPFFCSINLLGNHSNLHLQKSRLEHIHREKCR